MNKTIMLMAVLAITGAVHAAAPSLDVTKVISFNDLSAEQKEALKSHVLDSRTLSVLTGSHESVQKLVRMAMDFSGVLKGDQSAGDKAKNAFNVLAGGRYNALYNKMTETVEHGQNLEPALRRKFFVTKLLQTLVAYDDARRAGFSADSVKGAAEGLFNNSDKAGDDVMGPIFRKALGFAAGAGLIGFGGLPLQVALSLMGVKDGAPDMKVLGDRTSQAKQMAALAKQWQALSQGGQGAVKPVLQATVDLTQSLVESMAPELKKQAQQKMMDMAKERLPGGMLIEGAQRVQQGAQHVQRGAQFLDSLNAAAAE